MSNEIATYSMILSKLSLGKSGTECPTKTQILAINSLIVIDNASTYGANECVKIDDIRKKAETWNYYLTVSPTSMSFGAGGGSKQFTYSSYKRKVLDGVEQSGDISVSLKTISASGTGFSVSGTTVSASANQTASNRTGTVTITQNESNKTATITVTQAGAEPTIEYVFRISPRQVNVGASGGTGDIGFTSYKLVNGNQISLGYSIDSSTLPSWATYSNGRFTISSNSSTSSRSANVYFTQSESGKRDYATISQSGYVPPADNYVFTWEDGSTSDVSASFPWDFSTNGTAANIPVVSTKNGSSQSWSVSSKPSWITTSTTSSKVTISASDNSGSARSGEVVLTQSGSGKTLTINVSQDAKAADTYSWQIKKSSEPNEDAYWRQSITYDVPAKTTGFSGGWSVKGRKNGEIFAEYTVSSDSPSWLTVSGISYTVQHNTSSSSRSGTLTLTQAESGLKCYIVINQAGYTPTYTFNATPTNLRVDAITNTYSFTVNSSKTILNDDGSESSERIGWTGTEDVDWIYLINASNRPNQIWTANNETTLQRTAKITLTQDGTGIQAFVNVIQEAGAESNNELYINSINYDSVHLFGNGEIPHSGSQSYFLVSTGVPIPWKTRNGLVVNGGTVYAGDTISVYVPRNNSYTLLHSFALKTGVQRVVV